MEGSIIVGDAQAQVAAVTAGSGIAQLATWLIAEQLAAGTLVLVLPALETEGLPLNIIWPLGRQLLPKVTTVLELLSQELKIQ